MKTINAYLGVVGILGFLCYLGACYAYAALVRGSK